MSLELPGELTAPVTRSRGLFLLVTTKCDIACTYCFYTTGHEARDPNVFDLDQADVLAERLAALRFGTVILTGGDPLSTKDKHRTILLTRQLADSGVRVIINTSGVFLDEADCRQLVEAGPARIDFSIDSCDKHTHNRQRGRFTDTVNAIQTLRDLGFDDIVTTTVVTKRNRHQIEDTWEFLNELGATESRFQPAFLPVVNPGLGLRMDDEVRKQLEAIATKPRAAIHLGKYFRLWEKYHGDPDLAPSDSERRCSMGKDMFVSDSLGNLTGCFHREDVKLGNLLSDDVSGLDKAMTSNPLVQYELPPCAGPHCTSLFDDPTNWKS